MSSLAQGIEVQPRSTKKRARVPVLFVIDELCREGGAENIFARMIELLPRDRYRCLAVTFRADAGLRMVKEFPCPLTILPLRRTYDWQAARVGWQLRSLIRRNKIQIVHTFFETSDLWGGAVARLSGCPILISSRRDMGIQRAPKHGLAYRLLGGMFAEVQTVSEAVRKYCIETDKMPPRKVRTLYNGVALGERSLRPGTPVRDPVVTTVGHIRKVKGFDLFIRAAARICHEFPRARFQIVGSIQDTAHYRELERLTRELAIEANFAFLGHREDIPQLLAQSDVFCLFSRSEGLSNALLEAMAAGLPCIATDVGGNRELLGHAGDGLLIANEDLEGAVRALRFLLSDFQAAGEKGTENRRIVQERFSEERMEAEIMRSYEQLLCQHGL